MQLYTVSVTVYVNAPKGATKTALAALARERLLEILPEDAADYEDDAELAHRTGSESA